jgi:hypothetical protein
MDIIASTMHKDYRYISYPRSLGKPEETREVWVERFAGVISLWTGDGPEVNYIWLLLGPPSPRLSSSHRWSSIH